MTLIKSISGIRGTIGGKSGEGLSPLDIVKFTAAYATLIKKNSSQSKISIVVGRDARISGPMVDQLVCGTLIGLGVNVIEIGLATTPTTEMAVTRFKAAGGIIITASHNPTQWNALKLLNSLGEFISDSEGKEVLKIAENESFEFASVEELGQITLVDDMLNYHVEEILKLPLVDVKAIKEADFEIVIDAVNSVGGIALPYLLQKLGVEQIIKLYCDPNGHFPHNPEPLPENLTAISEKIINYNADLGFVVDPDVDRLAIVNEDGTMFGEEYTLVAVADYILKSKKGNTVSNLSSSKALKDVTLNYGGQYYAAAVGEVNVVNKMNEVQAVIGGEGNGGVIYPELHNGRDALVGVALFLSHLAKSGKKCSELRAQYPEYVISKNKIQLKPEMDVDAILTKFIEYYKSQPVELITIDGIRIDFTNEWVQLRKSNTEPIIRIYAESNSADKANALAKRIMDQINSFM
jgi:phosphomannomutase